MKRAYIYPGQGSQFVGMGESLAAHAGGTRMLEEANDILGFDIKQIMLEGSEEELTQTKVTQPAVFLHSVVSNHLAVERDIPDAVAGHSLGEFSALVSAGVLNFQDGLRLVAERALAMQRACEERPGTMAAIVGLEDEIVEQVCAETPGIVVAANYNCPGQLVISGEVAAVHAACDSLKEKGAKRALVLQVGGAFHSPLMASAENQLAEAIRSTGFLAAQAKVYQNVDGEPHEDVEEIKQNLIQQLTSPVRWVKLINRMIADGASEFFEVGGNGKVLRGMLRRINREIPCSTLQTS